MNIIIYNINPLLNFNEEYMYALIRLIQLTYMTLHVYWENISLRLIHCLYFDENTHRYICCHKLNIHLVEV